MFGNGRIFTHQLTPERIDWTPSRTRTAETAKPRTIKSNYAICSLPIRRQVLMAASKMYILLVDDHIALS